jgi:hypothetical protein
MTMLPFKRTFANVAAAQTDAVLVPAIPTDGQGRNKAIRVCGLILSGTAAATSITLNSKPSGAGGAISPTINVPANTTVTVDVAEAGWFETVQGQGLSCTTAAGSGVGVQVVYSEV